VKNHDSAATAGRGKTRQENVLLQERESSSGPKDVQGGVRTRIIYRVTSSFARSPSLVKGGKGERKIGGGTTTENHLSSFKNPVGKKGMKIPK